MQPQFHYFLLHHHHPDHHHHHIPLFLLCPCSCHHRHPYHHHHQFPSPNPHHPNRGNLRPPSFSQVLPNRSSAVPLQNYCSMGHDGTEIAEAAAEAKVADFSAAGSQEQEWNENQVLEDDEEIFVLTDEWMEFFAKSEAKRKKAKQQKKKGGK